jgi:carboxymethylenebutenolidase
MERPLKVADSETTIYVAPAHGEAKARVLLLHPWWGLTDDVRGFADRLAASGFTAAAPDLFRGRTATTVEDAEKLVEGFDDTFGEQTTTAAYEALLAEDAGHVPAAVVGFSFGAAWAIWLSAQRSDVAGVVLYYGTWVGEILAESTAPILGLFAENDPYEDAETVAALEKTCRDAGRQIEVHTYPGAGHWFAEPSRDAYVAEAADDAFERTVAFLGKLHDG